MKCYHCGHPINNKLLPACPMCGSGSVLSYRDSAIRAAARCARSQNPPRDVLKWWRSLCHEDQATAIVDTIACLLHLADTVPRTTDYLSADSTLAEGCIRMAQFHHRAESTPYQGEEATR